MNRYRKPTDYMCPECGIQLMDDTCDGFYECDECGNIISAPISATQGDDMNKYIGDELAINEWPFGCEIMALDSASAVIVRSPKDAKAIIESLGRYIDSCSPAKPSKNILTPTDSRWRDNTPGQPF